MAINKFTKSQLSAIDAKCPILVSAAAGSGKTAVLTERVIKKLTGDNPVDADKLLIVTFTNAAAFEMRSRIEKRLFEECAKSPANNKLMRQRHLIGSADICTIDSFWRTTRRQMVTGRDWPMRWLRSAAWSSTAGFHQGS